MDKDDLPAHDEHNDNPTAKVPLHEPSEDALERTPAVEQRLGAEPPLDRALSLEMLQEDLMGGAPSEELAPVRTAEQAEVVMKAREAHIEEATPVVVEAAQASSQEPWWKRIFAGWSREEEAAEILSEAGPEEALKEGLTSEGALPAVPADQPGLEVAQEVAPITEEDLEAAAPVPWWRWLLTWLTGEEGSDGVTPDEEAAPVTADEARALLGEELACLREDTAGMVHHELERAQEKMAHSVEEQVPGLVQAELARELGDHYRAAQRALRAVGDEMAVANLQWLQAQQDLLSQEVLPALQDPDLPWRERLELMDLVGDRPVQVAGQMAGLEAAVAKRVAEADQALAELDGRSSVAALHEIVAKLEAQGRRSGWGSWGLVPTVLALLLVAAVGAAGILLPRVQEVPGAIYAELGALYQANGMNERADKMLAQALELGIPDADSWAVVGQAYNGTREYSEAVEALEQAVEQEPQNVSYLARLAASSNSDGQYWKAIEAYRQAIDASPSPDAWLFVELAKSHYNLKDHGNALTWLERALEIDPESASAYSWRGHVYSAQGDYRKAVEDFEESLALDPEDYEAYINLGRSYIDLEDTEAALAQFELAADLDPEEAAALFWAGEAYRAAGRYSRSIELYEQALELKPDSAQYLNGLGEAYRAQGDCDRATDAFLRALDVLPGLPAALDGLEACESE